MGQSWLSDPVNDWHFHDLAEKYERLQIHETVKNVSFRDEEEKKEGEKKKKNEKKCFGLRIYIHFFGNKGGDGRDLANWKANVPRMKRTEKSSLTVAVWEGWTVETRRVPIYGSNWFTWKPLVLNQNIWNHMIVCKLFVLKIITRNYNCSKRIIMRYLKRYDCLQIIGI